MVHPRAENYGKPCARITAALPLRRLDEKACRLRRVAVRNRSRQHHALAALKLAPYVFVRPGELRKMEHAELNLDAAEWRIPGERMKKGELHIVPLSTQAVDILRGVQLLTGNGRYVFLRC